MKQAILIIPFLLLVFSASLVGAEGYPWMDHAFPFDFLFGNFIDTHQQTQLQTDGELFGFLYITFTGGVTEDGLPIARHCDENTPPEECVVGWMIRGKRGVARFVFHENDHPLWLVVSRADIPQPGAFSHFHWITNERCPAVHAHELEMLGITTCDGFFLELQAVNTFAFLHANQVIPVVPGLDIATHVNIVGSFPVEKRKH